MTRDLDVTLDKAECDLVESLLTTEQYPSQDDIQAIHRAMDGDSSKIADIQATIEQYQATIDVLRARIQRHEAACAPVRKLPEELLAKIFEHLVFDNFTAFLESTYDTMWPNVHEVPDNTKATKPLMLVCRRWRRVAISSPILWTRLAGSCSPYELESRVNLCPLTLLERLSRSGGLLVDLRLGTREVPLTLPLGSQLLLPNTLCALTHKLARLELFLSDDLMPILANCTPFDAPGLKQVKIRLSENPETRNIVDRVLDIQAFQNVPIEEFILQEEGEGRGRYILQWQNLTRLSLVIPSIAACVAILRYCRALERCDLHVSNSSAIPVQGNVALLPELRSLVLRADSLVDEFFNHICAPALHDLFLGQEGTRLITGPALASLLARAKGSLQSLIIKDLIMTDIEFVHCLEHTPCLTDFILIGEDSSESIITSHFFRCLTVDASHVLLPRLERINLFQCMLSSDAGRPLLEMLQSRHPAEGRVLPESVSQLVRVDIFLHSPPLNDEVRKEMDDLVSQGLQLSVRDQL